MTNLNTWWNILKYRQANWKMPLHKHMTCCKTLHRKKKITLEFTNQSPSNERRSGPLHRTLWCAFHHIALELLFYEEPEHVVGATTPVKLWTGQQRRMFRTGRGNHPSHRPVERQLTHEITGGCRIQSGICMAWHTAPVPLSEFHQGFVKHTALGLWPFEVSRNRIASTLARICSTSAAFSSKRLNSRMSKGNTFSKASIPGYLQ